jgi:hypothetical protein
LILSGVLAGSSVSLALGRASVGVLASALNRGVGATLVRDALVNDARVVCVGVASLGLILAASGGRASTNTTRVTVIAEVILGLVLAARGGVARVNSASNVVITGEGGGEAGTSERIARVDSALVTILAIDDGVNTLTINTSVGGASVVVVVTTSHRVRASAVSLTDSNEAAAGGISALGVRGALVSVLAGVGDGFDRG